MKIELVENQKVKVTLSDSDLVYYNLKPETLSPNSAELHRFLFNIMDNVRHETGFNPYRGQVVVEAVRSGCGITLYISKIKEKERQVSLENAKKVCRVKAVKPRSTKRRNRYMFSDFDSLIGAIKQLKNNVLSVSSLYRYNARWYFILGDCCSFDTAHSVLSEYCSEFGGMVYSEDFLDEHGEKVADRYSLVTMGDGIKRVYGTGNGKCE